MSNPRYYYCITIVSCLFYSRTHPHIHPAGQTPTFFRDTQMDNSCRNSRRWSSGWCLCYCTVVSSAINSNAFPSNEHPRGVARGRWGPMGPKGPKKAMIHKALETINFTQICGENGTEVFWTSASPFSKSWQWPCTRLFELPLDTKFK